MCMLSVLSQIADFGMPRGLSEDSIYYMAESAKFPIRWTGPAAEVSKTLKLTVFITLETYIVYSMYMGTCMRKLRVYASASLWLQLSTW